MPLCLANYSDPILPCREVKEIRFHRALTIERTKNYFFEFFFKVCERVRTPCESFYARYGLVWPDALNCEQYPSSQKNELCMDPRKNQAQSSSTSLIRKSQSCCQCNTTLGYRLIDDDHYPTMKKCLPPCRSAYFSDDQSISTMTTWLSLLSILCSLSSLFVLLTFFLDNNRFRYPQRPIIFLSLCYFFISFGYLIRLIVGHENVACYLDEKVMTINPPFHLVAFIFIDDYFLQSMSFE